VRYTRIHNRRARNGFRNIESVGRLNWGNEAIPTPRQRFDKAWIRGGIAKCFPDFIDSSVQAVVEVDEGVRRPDSLSQLLSRNRLTRPGKKRSQYLKRLILKTYLEALLSQFTSGEVGFKDAEPDNARSRGRL
jgi:hypothetical protein